MQPRPLGRRAPPDWNHIQKYPMRAMGIATPILVERVLPLPDFHKGWNQNDEGACVGFGCTMMMSITNLLQESKTQPCHYNPWKVWKAAKLIDEWPNSGPDDNLGTSVRAACQTMKDKGNIIWCEGIDNRVYDRDDWVLDYGIDAYRWATTVDEVRACIHSGIPLAIGVNWYTGMDTPIQRNGDWWLPTGDIGYARGGHCVCVHGASDQRQAVIFKNSWGEAYPETWMPYSLLGRLIQEQGEVALITDR